MQVLSCASFSVLNNGTVSCTDPQIIEVTELTITQANELFAAAALVLSVAWIFKQILRSINNSR